MPEEWQAWKFQSTEFESRITGRALRRFDAVRKLFPNQANFFIVGESDWSRNNAFYTYTGCVR